MKALLLLLATAAGAGFVFHEQLQTWLRPPPPDEVYYLRAGYRTTNLDGSVVSWSPGQALRLTHQASAAAGSVALTDGTNVLQVSRNALTRDVNDAASLRRTDLANQSAARLAAEQDLARQANESYLAGLQSRNLQVPAVVSPGPVYYNHVYIVNSTPAPALPIYRQAAPVHGMATANP